MYKTLKYFSIPIAFVFLLFFSETEDVIVQPHSQCEIYAKQKDVEHPLVSCDWMLLGLSLSIC